MVRLNKKEKKEIMEAIRQTEKHSSGQIRVHLKDRGAGDIFEEAKKTFVRLGMHRTAERNAVLIFVALNNRRFAILGDSGIHEKVGQDFWHHARDAMAHFLTKGELKNALLTGIGSIAVELKTHFPPKNGSVNELPNQVTEN